MSFPIDTRVIYYSFEDSTFENRGEYDIFEGFGEQTIENKEFNNNTLKRKRPEENNEPSEENNVPCKNQINLVPPKKMQKFNNDVNNNPHPNIQHLLTMIEQFRKKSQELATKNIELEFKVENESKIIKTLESENKKLRSESKKITELYNDAMNELESTKISRDSLLDSINIYKLECDNKILERDLLIASIKNNKGVTNENKDFKIASLENTIKLLNMDKNFLLKNLQELQVHNQIMHAQSHALNSNIEYFVNESKKEDS